ncbi:MAG TPA: Nramp family divalent metal transporter [Pyrinomonadaceae bacterium]|nr:Nramp family divalent metal transporter [Pyrinomonadaceae bacterium]
MAPDTESAAAIHKEARSGLEPWKTTTLPAPPPARGLALLGVIGPGAIILGASLGSGEWLLGPATFVKYGVALLWLTTVAVFLQTVLNTELIRYTMYTGEPAITGFMRTKPHSTFWAWFYAGLFLLQTGWPAWAATAAGAIFFLFTGNLAGTADSTTVYWIGCGAFLVCVGILVFSGQRIERTLEIVNWIMIVVILGTLLVLCLLFAAPEYWLAATAGLGGFDLQAGEFKFLPAEADWLLIGAFVGYCGMGGVGNLMVSNWARDKGYGMGQVVGFIPAAVGGQKVKLAHTGSVFKVSDKNLQSWRGWWRIVKVDQWGVFFIGGILGMLLPAILYTSAIEPGRDIRGLGIAAELAHSMSARGGAVVTFILAMMSVWVLFKTQLDLLEGMSRGITDILWSGSRRIRSWRGGDVRFVYYSVLGLAVVWGLIALRLTQPIILLQLGANMAGLVMVISSLHILYINLKFLPKELQPPLWRRLALMFMAVFYAFFVYLWLLGGLIPNPEKGFLFTLLRLLGIML